MERGQLLLQEVRDDYYLLMKWSSLPLLFVMGGMVYLIAMCTKIYLDSGMPIEDVWWITTTTGLNLLVIFILFYFGLSPGLRRARFKIYENGFVPHYVPLKYCLRKDDYFIPWEKVRFGTFFDPLVDVKDPLGIATYHFQKLIFRKKFRTRLDHCGYFLHAKKTPTVAIGANKEVYVRVAIGLGRFVGPNEEKLTSEDVMKILKEKVKIEEKVKMVPFEEFVQRGGMMGLGDS